MISSSLLTRTAATASNTITSRMMMMRTPISAVSIIPGTTTTTTITTTLLRWKSNNTNNNNGNNKNNKNKNNKNTSNTKKQRRVPSKGSGYYYNRHSQNGKELRKMNQKMLAAQKGKGKKEPFDISTPIPKIGGTKEPMDSMKTPFPLTDTLQITNGENADYDNAINDTDCLLKLDDFEDDDLSELGTLMGGALRSLRHTNQKKEASGGDDDGMDDIENKLRLMDYFVSEDGSTTDLQGTRRAVSMETYSGNPQDAQAMLERIETVVDDERFNYMELPKTNTFSENENDDAIEKSAGAAGAIDQIPHNQLAHGDWGEMLIRTDRVSKMWRGGRIATFRALVIGGNTRGCGGFGLGKAFEPEDAVAIACRMAKRNIFFVDRYRNRTISRDLVGRQNSCKVVLRCTSNGLRGNPLCVEILKLMGIVNVVAKAHGNRNHYNVVRATFKALLTHESLDEIAMKRGIRLINLQRAKRLGI
eukprot:CAMPEP_0170798022 /NCGR_PEP_ID=MMETSP0733-20121128/26039_1 /TAXON_ID=186038 /ORGANISM="Fragilariopsis kerguelensis, Strain L26-C5" /LENGTH=474 /DNA_ID=CAMNT_0011149157 /DNA_START=174 /DNA_END=1598 /DNA_ORIENTATION=+